MPQAVGAKGASVRSRTEIRNADGTLRVIMFSVDKPVLPKEPSEPKQHERWEKRCEELMADYQAVQEYHTRRISFAEKYKHNVIPEKYRTGESSPRNKKEAEKAIAVLNKAEQLTKINQGRK